MGRKRKRVAAIPEEPSDEQDPGVSWVKVAVYIVILIAIAVSAHLLLNRDRTSSRRDRAEQTGNESQVADAEPAAADSGDASEGQADLSKLKGRWQPTDAAYQIDIKEVKSDGSLQASYYNPGPISVSEAKATEEAGTAKVFIELRDVGYPGCTYDLTYDDEQDCLRGIYFQAAQQQRYPVEFVRQ